MEKMTFGQFLADCRQKKGLTQKELADKLYVGESAVSKWEKDKRQPGLELITRLSEIFDMTESELIRASVDKKRIAEKKQARNFRIINNTYNFTLFISFGIALLVCFIVNLAVSHKLSWFFVVLSAIVLAGIVLILPQYIKKHRILFIPLSWLLGLYLLLGVSCIYTKGNWFFIPVFALLLAYSLIFTPLLIKVYLPAKFKRHNALLSVAVDAALLFLLLLVCDFYTWLTNEKEFGWSIIKGLPIQLFWMISIVATVALLRYTKLNRFNKTSLIMTIWLIMCNTFMYGFTKLLKIEGTSGKFWQANLASWSSDKLINANVMLLTNVFVAVLIVFFAFLGITKYIKSKDEYN